MTCVAVVGAGSWGTTVAALAARNAPTILWARRAALAEQIADEHVNGDYLDGEELPCALRATADLEEAVGDADVLVMAVPSHGFRAIFERVLPGLRPGIPIVSLTKGLEPVTHRRMTEIVDELAPGHSAGVLTGPNIAVEVLRGYAAAAVIAMPDEHAAATVADLFRTRVFRVYTSTDVAGAEFGGALKNVFAIAAGMAQGLGAGDNTRAAVISRGLREMTRLGTECGGRDDTFAGLAGLGDLLATCISPRSRNRTVGEQLALGSTLEEIRAEMRMVAEGVRTSDAVVELAAEHGVEMPIAQRVHAVVRGDETPEEAFDGLLRTTHTTELAPG